MKNLRGPNIKTLAMLGDIGNKATFGFNTATIGLDATNLGFNKTSSLIKRRSYSNISAVNNRWWKKSSKAMPAPSTLRMQHLRKLACSSVEALPREMLKYLKDMQVFQSLMPANQKNFYSSSRSGSGKSKNSKVWVDYSLFGAPNDLENLKKEFCYSGKLKVGELYSVLFKVRKGDLYLMMGTKQEKVKFNSIND